jgi:hypothetical protein
MLTTVEIKLVSMLSEVDGQIQSVQRALRLTLWFVMSPGTGAIGCVGVHPSCATEVDNTIVNGLFMKA